MEFRYDDGAAADQSTGLLDPDGGIDNALTALIGFAGGALVGLVTLVLFAFIVHWWSLLLGGIAWFGGTWYLCNRHRASEAVQKTCYALGLLLVLFPVVAFSDVIGVGSFGERVFLFAAGEFAFGFVALVLAAVGHTVGN